MLVKRNKNMVISITSFSFMILYLAILDGLVKQNCGKNVPLILIKIIK